MRRGWGAVLFALLLAPLLAAAHKSSDAFLRLQVEGSEIRGRWDVALRDLALVLPLDGDGDGVITWGELKGSQGDIAAHALARLEIAADGRACSAQPTGHKVERHTDGAYAAIELVVRCPRAPAALDLRYRLFADEDAQHRALLTLDAGGKSRAAVLRNDAPAQRYELAAPGAVAIFVDYAREGVWHIWLGFDHLLFLATLLLPAVLVRENGRWRARGSARAAAADALWVVTAFTLAHSITLAAAVTGWISLPSRLVESAVALSVILAALNNVYPVLSQRRWPMAFAFGLVHGLGFASALAEVGLPQGAFALALVAFNLGVESGQVVAVLALLPPAFLLRGGAFYRRAVMTGGSLAIAAVATLWLIERTLDISLLPALSL